MIYLCLVPKSLEVALKYWSKLFFIKTSPPLSVCSKKRKVLIDVLLRDKKVNSKSHFLGKEIMFDLLEKCTINISPPRFMLLLYCVNPRETPLHELIKITYRYCYGYYFSTLATCKFSIEIRRVLKVSKLFQPFSIAVEMPSHVFRALLIPIKTFKAAETTWPRCG